MSLSGLNISMGILESQIPQLFSDPIAVASTWSADYYTLSGATVTDLANPAGNDFDTINLTQVDLVTDGDGTDWFEDPLSGILNSETVILAAADEATIGATVDGIITLESYRMKADDTAGFSGFNNSGLALSLGSPSKVFWRNLRGKSGAALNGQVDLEFYQQTVTGILQSNGGQDQYVGPRRGQGLGTGGALGSGIYDPDGNVLTAAAYSAGDDIVISWFLQPGGIRLMINGQFVTLYSARQRNADGTASDAALEAQVLAEDWSPRKLNENAGLTIGDPVPAASFNWGADTKCDYMGIFTGAFSDSYIQRAHSILLNTKPT